MNFLRKVSIVIYLLNSLQFTSGIILINTVLPINFYEVIKVYTSCMYSFIPDWEEGMN